MLSFFLVMTKTLKFLTALIALSLATPALEAATPPQTPRLAFVRVTATTADSKGVIPLSQPLTYSDGVTMFQGEEIATLYVVLKPGVTLSATDEPPFDIAADGTIIADSSKVDRLVWPAVGNERAESHGSYMDSPASTTNAGFPVGNWFPEYGNVNYNRVLLSYSYISMDCYWRQGEPGLTEGQTLALYFIVLDTRTYDPASDSVRVTVSDAKGEKAPVRIAFWDAVLCKTLTALPSGMPEMIMLNIPEPHSGENQSGEAGFVRLKYDDEQLIAPIHPTRVAALPSAITVDGVAVTDPEQVEAALKPSISGMVATTIVGEDGSETPAFSFSLTPPEAPGLMAYELWTADKLDDPSAWEPFATFLTKNGFDTADEMRYTRLRIEREDSTPTLQIPLVTGEKTRFYQLRAAGSGTGE